MTSTNDIVEAIENVLVKLKQDPVKLAEEKEVQYKTMEVKYDVLEKNYKLLKEYVATLEQQNELLKKSQCDCSDVSCCNKNLVSKPAASAASAASASISSLASAASVLPCDIAVGICSVGGPNSKSGSCPLKFNSSYNNTSNDDEYASKNDEFWDNFWYYFMIGVFIYYMILMFIDQSNYQPTICRYAL